MRHVFLINPASGKRDAARLLRPQIEAAAQARGVEYEVALTKAPRHAEALARQAAGAGGAVRLYAVGGDGTLNEVFNGAYPSRHAEVAHIPCGSGNDYIRNFGSVADFLDVPGQLAGAAVPVDLMQVEGGVCAAITSTGLDAEVAYNIPKYRRFPLLGGGMAYNLSILEKLLRPLGKTLSLTIDGRAMQGKYLIAAVCNGSYYGGGYNAAPHARLDDGYMDVVLVKKISRLLIASIIGKYKSGRHFGADGKLTPELARVMWHTRARKVEICPAGEEPFILNVDGECGPAPRLRAEMLPAAARFCLPAPLAAKAARPHAAARPGANTT